MMLLHDKIEHAKSLLSGVWLRKRIVLVVTLLGTLAGCFAVMLLPNQYESNAKVYADTKSLLKPLLQGMAVQVDSDEEVRVIAQNLLSKPNLEKIAQQSGLHLKYATPESYEVFLINLQKEISLTGSKKQNLFTISYKSSDPKQSKRVVELTLQSLVDSTLGESRQDNSSATDFLNEQIAEQKRKLELAERVLAEFKQQYQDVLPQRGGSYFQEVSQLRQQIEDAEVLLNEKSAGLESIKESVVGASVDSNQVQSLVSSPFDERIAQLEQTLVNLEVRYTDKHPDILEIRALLDGLNVQREQYRKKFLETVASGSAGFSEGAEQNALLDTSSKIVSLNSEINAIRARKEALERRLNTRLEMLGEIPQIEAELISLTRDYDTTSDLYQNLLKRRDSAELSKSASENTSEIKFRVIEPPSEPLLPSGPPRPMLYVIVFLMSLSFGVVAAFLVSQLSGVIQSREQLMSLVKDASVLPALPNFSYNSAKAKRHAWLFFMFMIGLVLFVVALVAHEVLTTHSPVFWLRGLV